MLTIAAEELKQKLEAGEPLELVDIREADEFAGWHIKGSRNLPVYDALKANQDDALVRKSEGLPGDRPIITICRGGIMSERAALLLISLGYDARSLEGGMRGWGGIWTVAPIASRGLRMFQIRRNGKGCLSYLLGAEGQAVVIDPCVETRAYLEQAEAEKLRITHVLETHVHADHVSRARELCRATGAELVMHVNQRVTFPYKPIRDGETIQLGGIVVEAIATPGHTAESCCYLVDERVLLSGDTLFVDSVGRPDLERGDAGAEDGARQLYQSLHECLLKRFDEVNFFPAHHAATIGFDRAPIGSSIRRARSDLELVQTDEETFVRTVLDSLLAKPPNHETIIAINEGRMDMSLGELLEIEAGPNSCAAGRAPRQ